MKPGCLSGKVAMVRIPTRLNWLNQMAFELLIFEILS